jgi:hypothetical protein
MFFDAISKQLMCYEVCNKVQTVFFWGGDITGTYCLVKMWMLCLVIVTHLNINVT